MSFIKFLFFTKSEKIAISILLLFIIVSGGIYMATSKSNSNADIDNYLDNSDFAAFQASMKNQESDTINNGNHKAYSSNQYSYSYIPPKKLKAGEVIDLNEADTMQLKMIPNIGSGYANRIIKYRNLLGGYNRLEQLKEVWGMDEYLYEKIIPYMVLKIRNGKMRINEASFHELNKHPYIDYKQAKIIIDIRERKGPIESIERLALLEEFSEKDLQRLSPYLSFK